MVSASAGLAPARHMLFEKSSPVWMRSGLPKALTSATIAHAVDAAATMPDADQLSQRLFFQGMSWNILVHRAIASSRHRVIASSHMVIEAHIPDRDQGTGLACGAPGRSAVVTGGSWPPLAVSGANIPTTAAAPSTDAASQKAAE